MAFDVTPTDGAGPYVLSAQYLNPQNFDLGLYVVELFSASEVGACPVPSTLGTSNSSLANGLLLSGSASHASPVPPGSCRQYVNLIRRVSDNEIVSQMEVYVDNVV